MNRNKDKAAECFGRLECVFPMGADGLRHTPSICQRCAEKIDCLRAAVRGEDGIAVKEEQLERAYTSGRIGFLERWARKKTYANCRSAQTPSSRRRCRADK